MEIASTGRPHTAVGVHSAGFDVKVQWSGARESLRVLPPVAELARVQLGLYVAARKMTDTKKVTAPWVRASKGQRRVAVVTAYDASFARLLDEGGADILLVGDSLGMVVQGLPNTLPVTLEDMAYHTRAVSRGARRAHIVTDLPFMSYQRSAESALSAAGHLVKTAGAEAVKLEGGVEIAESVKRIVDAGIPVMAHVGLTPQSVHRFGGFKVQGRTSQQAAALLADARALQDAGAYAVVVEGVPTDVGAELTRSLDIPTIGIGAGPACDGQVLVCYDLLGLFQEFTPKFVKRYAELGESVVSATRAYVEDVRVGSFPGKEHSFAPAVPVVKIPAESTGALPLAEPGPRSYGPAGDDE